MPFGEQLALDPLEPPNRLAGEPAHLGEVTADWKNLGPEPLADGLAHLARQRGLDLGSEVGERLDLLPRPLQRRLDVTGLDAPLGGGRQALLRALDGGLVHERRLPCSPDDMKVSELDYELPPALIAQHPLERRDDSRLLVCERASGEVRHRRFSDLPEELVRGELVVVNDTRVVPARIPIESPARG